MKLDLLLSDFWRGPERRNDLKPRGTSRCSVVFGYISPSGERSTFGDPDEEEKDRRDIMCCHVEVLPSLRVSDGGLAMVLSGTRRAVELVLDR